MSKASEKVKKEREEENLGLLLTADERQKNNPLLQYIIGQKLNCHGCKDLPINLLSEVVISYPEINFFDFSNCGLTGVSENDSHLIYALRFKKAPFSLNLADNPLNSKGGMALIRSLQINATAEYIVHLNLSGCNLDNNCATSALKKYIAQTTSNFIELNIARNSITDETLQEIIMVWKKVAGDFALRPNHDKGHLSKLSEIEIKLNDPFSEWHCDNAHSLPPYDFDDIESNYEIIEGRIMSPVNNVNSNHENIEANYEITKSRTISNASDASNASHHYIILTANNSDSSSASSDSLEYIDNTCLPSEMK